MLRPGGRLLMVNETLKTLRDPNGVHVEGVEQFEGYEHAHWALQYRWEATRAGFQTEVAEPHYRPFFGDASVRLRGSGMPLLGPFIRRGGRALHRNGLARRAYLAWLNDVWGTVSMNMIATKPAALRRAPRGDEHRRAPGAPGGRVGAPARRPPPRARPRAAAAHAGADREEGIARESPSACIRWHRNAKLLAYGSGQAWPDLLVPR